MGDPDVEMYNRALINALTADNYRLRAEIKRLRASLKQIIERYETAEDGWPAEDMRATASAALEQKASPSPRDDFSPENDPFPDERL